MKMEIHNIIENPPEAIKKLAMEHGIEVKEYMNMVRSAKVPMWVVDRATQMGTSVADYLTFALCTIYRSDDSIANKIL
jgi:hypothetical protein